MSKLKTFTKEIKKVLIANRGEIATRIIRACKELDIKTVAIYSEADAKSIYVKKADEAYLIPGDPIQAYLNYFRIVDLAKQTKCDAIHSGYGFLSENPEFAEYCWKQGIVFIGPHPDHIALFGDKMAAKKKMRELGVPVLPGSDEPISDIKKAKKIADEIGYPVILKAAFGGGGRGMRIVREESEFEDLFKSAFNEAKKFFGRGDVFIEKYVENPRHIEIQIMADKYGNVVHLGERDCSIQRRHQKVVEIARSPTLNEDVKRELYRTSVKAMFKVGYENVGTIEYLVDEKDNFYFIEMNTRLQVEHTVTEMVTGIDIVQQMIKIAQGEKLGFLQEDITMRGYAIEFRVNAEDPKRNFAPSVGAITSYHSPGGPGVRVDAAVYKDYVIPPYYDSMIAKLSVWALTWDQVVNRARRALDEFIVRGVPTNLPLLRAIVRDEDFIKGKFTTRYIEEKLPTFNLEDKTADLEDLVAAIAGAIAAYHKI
ncbi:pyruvate carboxylase (Pyruvic carboxylase) (PYC) [Sulfurihydrogenibium azorense Az-Fu1]|uniref:Pyruvate carboxylase (Pyruvic carboxylase) (PYC) n=1 Tax=Sulfurihydrogenibium azorense (strain DSM 15241 / OCM 825 / Az-Fu1) TaxID=204536 RepID=C1DWH6_SULAA|nr:acetyl-CoA carboxylase biotin carboxylase subunit [Sulfurihydrogenibium azorense]ACN98143.1 pyruvate carboxylase (Pyruvic carboxylase) (PYC) [Sulfurihydrogenibium azorense Az-Fu1]